MCHELIYHTSSLNPRLSEADKEKLFFFCLGEPVDEATIRHPSSENDRFSNSFPAIARPTKRTRTDLDTEITGSASKEARLQKGSG